MIIPFADMDHPYIDLLESQGKRNNIEVPFKNTYREQPLVSRSMFKEQDTWYVSVDVVEESSNATHVVPIMGKGGLKHFEFWYPNNKIAREFQVVPRRQDTDHPMLGTGLVLFRSDTNGGFELLLARRSKGPLSYVNRLSPFGGKVEHGERPWTACVREMREEIGLDLSRHTLNTSLISLPAINEVETDNGDKYHAVSMAFAMIISREFQFQNLEPHAHPDAGWYNTRHLSPRDLTPLTNKLLDSLDIKRSSRNGQPSLVLSNSAGNFI